MNTMFEVNTQDTEYIDLIERLSESYTPENLEDFTKSPLNEIENSYSPPKSQSQTPFNKTQSKIKQGASEIHGGFGLKFTRVGQHKEINDEDNYFDQYDENEDNENKKSIINEIYQQHVTDRYQSVHKSSIYAVPSQMPSVSKKISLLGDYRKNQSIIESQLTHRQVNPSNKSSSIQSDQLKFNEEDKKQLISAHDFHISPETLEDAQKYLDIVYTKLAESPDNSDSDRDFYVNNLIENLRRESVKQYLDQVYSNLEHEVIRQQPSLAPQYSEGGQAKPQKAGQFVQEVYKQVVGDFLKQKKPQLKEELLSTVYKSDRSIENCEFVVNEFLEQMLAETSKIVFDVSAEKADQKYAIGEDSTQKPPKKRKVDLRALAEDNLTNLMMTSDIIRNSVARDLNQDLSSNPSDLNVDSKKARFDKIKEIQRTFRKSRADVVQTSEDAIHNLIAQQKQNSLPSTPSSNQSEQKKTADIPQAKVLPISRNIDAVQNQQNELFAKKELREVEGVLSVSNNQGAQSHADSSDQHEARSNKVIVREFEKTITDAVKKLRPPGARVKFIGVPATSTGNISLGDTEPNNHRFKNLPVIGGRSQSNEQTKREAQRTSGCKDDSVFTAKSDSVIVNPLLKSCNIFEPDDTFSPPQGMNGQSPIFNLRKDSNMTNNDDKSTPLFKPSGHDGHSKFFKESLSNFAEDKFSLKNLPIKADSPAVELEGHGKVLSNDSDRAEEKIHNMATPQDDQQLNHSESEAVSIVKLDDLTIKKSEVIQRVLIQPRGSRAFESQRSIDFPEVAITVTKPKSSVLVVNSPDEELSQLQSSKFIKPTEKMNQTSDLSNNGVARKNSVEIEERTHRASRITVTNRQSMAKRQSIFPNEPVHLLDDEECAQESKTSFIPKSRRIIPLDDDTQLKIQIDYKMRCAERMNTILSKSRFANRSETESMLKDEMRKMIPVDFLVFVHSIAKEDQDKIIPLQRMVRKIINKKIMAKISVNTKMYQEMKTNIEARRTRLSSFVSRRSSASSKKYYG